MRRAAYPDLARGTGDGGWAVAAHTHTHIGPIDIGTGLLAENAIERAESRGGARGENRAHQWRDRPARVRWPTTSRSSG